MEVCPYKSIRQASLLEGMSLGTPVIYARRMPCYLCMKCPDACPSGALRPVSKTGVKMGLARIVAERCLAYHGVLCRTCYNACPVYDEAIVMDETLRPKVVAAKCFGCGICEYVCPTDPGSVVVEAADA